MRNDHPDYRGSSMRRGEAVAVVPEQIQPGTDARERSEIESSMFSTAGFRYRDLTERQHELLQMVADGMTSKEMANHTGMAIASIDNALSRVTRSMGARNRRAAAALYVAVKGQGQAELPFQAARHGMSGLLIDTAKDRGAGMSDMPKTRDESPKQELVGPSRSLLKLLLGPPLGGQSAPKDWRQIALQILWVAFIGILCVTGLTLFILAFYRTFG